MKRTLLLLLVAAGCIMLQTANAQQKKSSFDTTGFEFNIAEGPIEPTLESIGAAYESPEWFSDVKFGIYMHWGLNSVSGYNGHYGRLLYWNEPPKQWIKDKEAGKNVGSHATGYRPSNSAKFHQERFGHQSEFGYKDFIPLWKADKFDPDALAKLYKKSGAKFIGVMAVHHDNFDLYDSSHQEWNSVKMGPKIDIVQAWKDATEKVGLKFFISSHLSNNYHENAFYQGNNADESGPYAGIPYDYMDPQYDGLYGKRNEDRTKLLQPEFAKGWYLRTKELIDKYDPDLLYLDSAPVPNGDYGLNIAAHLYNSNFEDGKQTAIMTIKKPIAGFTLDLECKGINDIQKQPFLTDTSLTPGWFYLGDSMDNASAAGDDGMSDSYDKLRMDAGQVIDNLADIVSKNGSMMLNVGLCADGSLEKIYQKELLKIGKWLDKNGEAIYGTRPFRVYGQGDFQLSHEQLTAYADNTYIFTAKDIRYTTTPEAIYVIFLEDPSQEGEVILSAITEEDNIQSVEWLTSGKAIEWQQQADGLHLQMPKKVSGEYAFVAKITLNK